MKLSYSIGGFINFLLCSGSPSSTEGAIPFSFSSLIHREFQQEVPRQ